MAEEYSSSWRCPFCGHIVTIQSEDISVSKAPLYIGNAIGLVSLESIYIVCPNSKCKKFTLTVNLYKCRFENNRIVSEDKPLYHWPLIPQSAAKVLPDYVPKPIVSDYLEACSIKDLSPKASATLARRCLQGMIRNFWGISKSRLVDEIDALQDKVDTETWDAIDSLRHIGNIGAHMEKDINVIIDVDPQEAGLLIELIETLVDEWYVARHDRQERMAKIKAAGQAKKASKAPPPVQP